MPMRSSSAFCSPSSVCPCCWSWSLSSLSPFWIGPTALSYPRASRARTCSMSPRATPAPKSQGFIVVYPSGSDVPKIWHVDRGAGLVRDVAFISALIDTLEAAYNIDPPRIYSNGLSAGGGMAFVLSCTLSDRIAAVGLVAAAQPMDWSWCTDQRPVPVIAFHGAADPIVPYQGGPLGDPFSPV